MPNEKFLIRLSDVLKGVHQCSNDRSVLNNDVARTSWFVSSTFSYLDFGSVESGLQ